MPIDTLTSAYQTPMIEKKPVGIDAIEPDLNIDFEEKPHIRKEQSMRYMRD